MRETKLSYNRYTRNKIMPPKMVIKIEHKISQFQLKNDRTLTFSLKDCKCSSLENAHISFFLNNPSQMILRATQTYFE